MTAPARPGRPPLSGAARTLLRGAGSALSVKVAAVGIGFAVQLLLARLLGAVGYGDYVYALAWQNVLLIVGTLGYDATALRFVAVYHAEARWSALRGFLRRSHIMVAVTATGATILAVGIVFALRDRLRPELAATMVVAFLLLPFTAVLQLQSFGLLGLRRIVLAQAPRDVLRPFLLGAGVVLLAWVARPLVSAVSVMVVNLVSVLPALLITAWGTRRLLAPSMRGVTAEYRASEWTGVASFLFVIAGLQLLLERVDVLLLGAMLSTREAGVYAVAQRITGLLAIGLSAVNAIAAPMIAALHAGGKHDELQRTITLAVRGIFAFALPTGMVLVLFGRQVLALFGPEFTDGYVVLIVLTIGAVLNITGGLAGFLMTMTGYQREAARVIGAGVALSIALNLFLIPVWGMTGASIATVLALALRNALLRYFIRRRLHIRVSPLVALGRESPT